MLSERQKKIVDLILKHPQGVNATVISQEVRVSPRTIRNDIASINMCLMNNHCMINSSKRVGYFIVSDSVDKVKDCLSIIDAIDHKQIPSSPMERKYYMLGQLLYEGTITLYDIASVLYVSEQTIYKDIVSFQKVLKEKFHFEQLQLDNGTIRLCGNEEELRILFYRIIKEEIYLSNKLVDIHLYQLARDLIDVEELYDIVDYISGYCRTQEITVPDQMLYILAWMIAFTLHRCDQNHSITNSVLLQHNNESLKRMIDQLLQDLHYTLDSEDRTLLQNYMETLGLFSHQDTPLQHVDNEDVVQEFTKQMKHKYALDFETMPSLFSNFKSHLEFAVKRLLMDYQLINPLLQEVKTKYSFAYEIAMLMVPILYKKYKLYMQEDELSFLALYIQPFLKVQETSIHTLLVYGTTPSFTNFMEAWINQEFKDRLQVVGYTPLYNLSEEIKQRKVDLIISNVVLEKKMDTPVIEITQLPCESDRKRIENFISRQAMLSQSVSIFHKVFAKERIFFIEEDLSFEEILTCCAQRLEQQGKITERNSFVKDILTREVVYPTHIDHGCFMPHPLMNSAVNSAICMAIVKGHTVHNEQEVHILFVSAFEPKIDADLKYIYSLINTIATAQQLCKVLLEMKSANEVMEYLEKIIAIMKD